jgi:rhamnosyltransferase
MIDVSILLLTKNGAHDLKAVLPAVFSQKSMPRFELIAVDSGSTDETLQILRQFPVRIEQIPAQAFHHARTRNLVAGLAEGEVLIFLSQDAIPASEEWLKAMLVNFSDSSVGAVYGRQLPKPGCSLERQDALDAVYGQKRIVKDPARPNDTGYRFYHFSDANAAIRRSVWERTRFPEDCMVFEDLGIAKRILDAGYKIIYEPQSPVFHSHHHTTVALLKRYFDIGCTLKRLKIWDAPGTRLSLVRDGRKLFLRKLRRVVEGGAGQPERAAVRQYLAKSAGLFLGVNQSYLPVSVKRHLSAHGIFE